MNFTFWCVLADGRKCSIDTNNMFEAPRRARKMDAVACYCHNPSTGKTFKVAI
ncbi:hypothetical protein [Burkholderia ubonensis]|uniref:hypothetical protein n=1 Tax=Burkholderia ubonensis TaxID=101571 RepID=UPI000A51C64F|nr:hypothetical protein [Burkholderia ubonensis]